MPFLDYKCPNCGKTFQELVKSHLETVNCPTCNSVCERDYTGSVVGGLGKKTKKCTGDCKNCSGC